MRVQGLSTVRVRKNMVQSCRHDEYYTRAKEADENYTEFVCVGCGLIVKTVGIPYENYPTKNKIPNPNTEKDTKAKAKTTTK